MSAVSGPESPAVAPVGGRPPLLSWQEIVENPLALVCGWRTVPGPDPTRSTQTGFAIVVAPT